MKAPDLPRTCRACGHATQVDAALRELVTCPHCERAEPLGSAEIVGNYRLARRDHYSTIVLAVCETTGVPCHVRFYPDGLAAFSRVFTVAELYQRSAHRGLIEVLELRRPNNFDGTAWVAHARCPGRSLDSLRRERARLAPGASAALIAEVAAGLAVLHAAGMCFGWLSPSDITLTPRPVLGLPDLPSVRDDNGWSHDPVALLGNPTYAAPEWLTDAPVTPASDVFTLGLILWELVTGRSPGEDAGNLMERLSRRLAPLERARVSRPDCPRWLDDTIARALALDPAQRFPSAQAFIAALKPA